MEKFTARFKELVPEGIEEVFDLTEPATHSFIANGIVVSNCGEQVLLPYESCNLGSVNLARMLCVTDEETLEIDWERLRRVIHTGVRMLDNVIDMNKFPIPEIEEMSRKTRRIGLGVMGWADALIQLGIRYDSEEALQLAHQVMGFIQAATHRASGSLAKERGNFPAWEDSIYEEPMRNSAPVTIAPTGTISIIAGASSGIEPLFALSYVRNIMDGTRMVEVNPHFEALAIREGFHTPESDGTNSGNRQPERPGEPRIKKWRGPSPVGRRDLPHLPRHQPELACADAVSLPGPHRQLSIQDHQHARRRNPGGREERLRPGLHDQLQWHHRLPGREQGRTGTEHQCSAGGRRGKGTPGTAQVDDWGDGAIPHRARQHVRDAELRQRRTTPSRYSPTWGRREAATQPTSRQ